MAIHPRQDIVPWKERSNNYKSVDVNNKRGISPVSAKHDDSRF